MVGVQVLSVWRDRARSHGMSSSGVALHALRLSLGVIFIWFGALKFFPGVSPAEALASDTMRIMTRGVVPDRVALVLLATLETGIGLALVAGRAARVTLGLLLLHLAGTATPLFLLPTMAFEKFPLMLTMEGQYIVKNVVLVSAGLVLLAALPSVPAPVDQAPTEGATSRDHEYAGLQRLPRRSIGSESPGPSS